MLKKETRDTARRLVECLSILLIIPIVYATEKFIIRMGVNFREIAEFIVIAALVIFAVYAGATVFLAEKRDRAFEYLFSLPLARRRILGNKLAPRLAAVLALALLMPPLLGAESASYLGVSLFVLFFLALFLSIPVNSVILGFLGVGMLYYLCSLAGRMLYHLMIQLWRQNISPYNPKEHYSSMILAALLLLFPLGIAFWKTFKNLDLKPIPRQLKPYLTFALPAAAVMITLVVLYYNVYMRWLLNSM